MAKLSYSFFRTRKHKGSLDRRSLYH